MILYTKQGDRSELPFLFAYQGAVFAFQFNGNETYTDPFDSSIWNWEGVDNSLEEILGVIQEGKLLTPVISISDCLALVGSFFWDDTNGILYIHYFTSINDYAVSHISSIISKIIAGYASGYNETTDNVFDGVYYESLIIGLSGLNKKIDPTKLGLISFGESSFTLSNESGRFDNLDLTQVIGVPVWFYYAPEDATELTNDMRIFTGFITGFKNNRDNVTFSVIESRLFENKPICQNVLDIATYPDAGDNANQFIPVAFGDIRRGIMLPVNQGEKESPPDPFLVTFLVADPALYAVRAIDKVYDEAGVEFTIDSTDFTGCTVTVSSDDYSGTLAEFAGLNFKKWSWEGEGYDIDGTYTNGLDIIQAGYLKFANIPYLASTYNQIKWELETLENPQPAGLSVQSDKGFVDELIQPVVTSLQGSIDVLGDGRISYIRRDPTQPVQFTIYASEQLTEPSRDVSSKETVSEVFVQYSPNFTDPKKDFLSFLYNEKRNEVIGNYGIDNRDPISPLETVLTTETDAENTAIEIMETSDKPKDEIIVDSLQFRSSGLFGIIGADTGLFENENFEYGEVLSFDPDYLNGNSKFTIRKIDNPVFPSLYAQGFLSNFSLLNFNLIGYTRESG